MAIGTTAAIVGGVSAAAGLAGSVISGNKAGKAADTQAAAAANAAQVERQNFLDGLDLIQPSFEAGDIARQAMLFELGLGPAPTYGGEVNYSVGGTNFDTRDEALDYRQSLLDARTAPVAADAGGATILGGQYRSIPSGEGEYRLVFDPDGQAAGSNTYSAPVVAPAQPLDENGEVIPVPDVVENTISPATTYGGFTETPGYQFRLDEGQKAIERSAAARGMQLSGSTLKDLTRFGQDYASAEYTNHYNRLAGLAGAGQTAAQSGFAGFSNLGQSQANLITNAGNARASGYLAQGQAINNGLSNLTGVAGMFAPGFGGGFAPYNGGVPAIGGFY